MFLSQYIKYLTVISLAILLIYSPSLAQEPKAPATQPAAEAKTNVGGEAKQEAKTGAKADEAKKATKTPAATKRSDYSYYLKAGDRSPKWNELIEPGFSSFDSGNLATAAVFLKRAHERGCRDGLLLYRLGIFQESQRQYKVAADLLAEAAEKLPKQYPGHPLARGIHEHAARVLYQADDYARALPELKKALEHDPDNFVLIFMAGQLLRLNKSYAEARTLFEHALQIKPPEGLGLDPNQRVWRELMSVTYELGDLKACAAYADMIIAANPNDQIALSYKQKLERERLRKKELEIIEKIVK